MLVPVLNFSSGVSIVEGFINTPKCRLVKTFIKRQGFFSTFDCKYWRERKALYTFLLLCFLLYLYSVILCSSTK